MSTQDNFIPKDQWVNIVHTRQNGRQYLYVNGELANSSDSIRNLDFGDFDEFIIGKAQYLTGYYGDSANNYYSMVRLSASAMSAENVRWAFEQERKLFEEEAIGTFYNTDDNATALAYDSTTKMLHVGTNNGRSDFSGLVRVNHTTNSITKDIGASNGFIAED